MLLVLGSDTPISSHGQAEPTAAEGCSPHAHTDLHLVVLHTSDLSPVGFTPAHPREDLPKDVMFFLTGI